MPPADFTRDRYKRPLIGGEPYLRPSSLGKLLTDSHALDMWKQRMVLCGAAGRPELVARAATTDPSDKHTLNQLAGQALDAAQETKKADMGTAIHAALEMLLSGQDISRLPEDLRGTALRIQALLKQAGLTPVAQEIPMVSHELQTAGTCDLIVTGNRGGTFVADLKTGGVDSPKYSHVEWAVQLACYANAIPWDVDRDSQADHDLDPIDTSTGIVIHAPQTGEPPALYRVDLDHGKELTKLAITVKHARKTKTLTKVHITQKANTNA